MLSKLIMWKSYTGDCSLVATPASPGVAQAWKATLLPNPLIFILSAWNMSPRQITNVPMVEATKFLPLDLFGCFLGGLFTMTPEGRQLGDSMLLTLHGVEFLKGAWFALIDEQFAKASTVRKPVHCITGSPEQTATEIQLQRVAEPNVALGFLRGEGLSWASFATIESTKVQKVFLGTLKQRCLQLPNHHKKATHLTRTRTQSEAEALATAKAEWAIQSAWTQRPRPCRVFSSYTSAFSPIVLVPMENSAPCSPW